MAMTSDTMRLVDSMAMDCDESFDLDIPTANQAVVGSSPGYCQLRSGRRIFKPSGNGSFQNSKVKGKPKRPSRGVRKKKKRGQRQATTATEGKRQQQIQDAITNGSNLFNEAQNNGNIFSTAQYQPEQLQRLTNELVLQALFGQTPGLTFPSQPSSSPFSTEEMIDLIKALEDYQITLARMGNAIQSPDVGKLVKTFTHDILSLLSQIKQCGRSSDGNELWDAMSYSLKAKGLRGWLRGTVMRKLDEICGVGIARHLRRARAFNKAIVAPGKYQELDLAITYARQQLGEPHYGRSATLRSLVGHFEAARTRYLSSINHSGRTAPYAQGDVDMEGGYSGGAQPFHPLGMQPRRRDMDSSDEEHSCHGDSGAEADVEDNIQVEGELLHGRDRALIRMLDLWMEPFKEGVRQDSVDVDMLSAFIRADFITPLASSLTQIAGGIRDNLPDSESESSDGSFTAAPEQPKPSDYESVSALQRSRSAFFESGASIAAPPGSLLSINGLGAIGSHANMADIRDTVTSCGEPDGTHGSVDVANEKDTPVELDCSQGRINLPNRIKSIPDHEEHHGHAIFNTIKPRSGLCQGGEGTADEALTLAVRGSTVSALPDGDAAVMDEDSVSYYSANEWWGGDDSDGDASAVEEFGNAEYSFSDVDVSDEDTRDEESVDGEWIRSILEGESLDDGDEASEGSDTEDMDSGEEDEIAAPLPQLLPPVTPSCPVVVPNEALSEQLKKRNPWRTLERYYPRQGNATDAAPCFPILRLPIELLCMVANNLPPESAASLALSSKQTYMSLGMKYLKFADNSSLWQFLLLIEPERQASFACCVCLKLHRPSISQRMGVSKCTKLWKKRENARFPASITSGLVKMIGRKHLEDPRVCQEYLSWAAKSTKITTRHMKVAQHVIPRMVDGNLLIKTETYVAPCRNGRLTHRSLYELLRLLEHPWHDNDKLYDICAHRSWENEIGISKQLRKYVHGPLANKCVRRACSTGFHYRKCYGNDVVSGKLSHEMLPLIMQWLLNSQHSSLPSSKTSAGQKVHRCNQCVTDYSIAVRDVAGVGRCMVFTTWKDLGGVRPGEADKWDTFYSAGRPLDAFLPRAKPDRPDRQPPSVPRTYLTYQDVEVQYSIFRTINTVYHYRPEPDQKMIRDLTRRPKRRDYMANDGEYPTTASDADTATDTDSGEDNGSLSSRLFWRI